MKVNIPTSMDPSWVMGPSTSPGYFDATEKLLAALFAALLLPLHRPNLKYSMVWLGNLSTNILKGGLKNIYTQILDTIQGSYIEQKKKYIYIYLFK